MMKDKIEAEILAEIAENDDSALSWHEKYIRLKQILERSCKDITSGESLQFPSLFSRLVFISQKYGLPRSLEWELQNIRVTSSNLLRDENTSVSPLQYGNAKRVVLSFVEIVYENDLPKSAASTDAGIGNNLATADADRIRIQVTGIDREKECIEGKADSALDLTIRFRYNVRNVNDTFNPTIERLWIGAQLNLLGCVPDKDGTYIPKTMVLEPDYLIDTSSMAECFQNYGWSHLHYFRKKFEATRNSSHILLGNLANFFLDELIFAEVPDTIAFDKVFLESFKQKPFEFTSCNEIRKPEDFKAFMAKARIQFDNIKRVVTTDFPKNGIATEHCMLEPSFFCEKYGFQGRLDLLQLSETKSKPHRIVELKSGGLPFPKNDTGKIAINHEVQTAIYRLIIESVFNADARQVSAAILYSAAENAGQNLRLAATYQVLEKQIINTRNLIVSTEHDLYTGDAATVEKLFSDIFAMTDQGRIPDFFRLQITDFQRAINSVKPIERSYFFRYIIFIARELYIQKTGDDFAESSKSTSGLWNTEFSERQESFDLLAGLEIISIDESGRDMKIILKRSDSSEFVNFREGEICILYPHEKLSDNVLTNQILKGTIAEILPDRILLRFRYKQRNKDFFTKYKWWAIEHDQLDHSLTHMYKSLFAFITSDIRKRSLILGFEKPKSAYLQTYIEQEKITDHIREKQRSVLEKAIAAEDYFLIVGPPGTGKTSVFARRLIEYYYNCTSDNILIVAYTNRAVDELCEAINQAFGCNRQDCCDYIRIGTELSCGEPYRHRLLQNIAVSVKNRGELRTQIRENRIFIGTLAAISGKPELFDIKKFNISIIDESSQILEPQIVGLLPKVDKFIMIGDHKQLSTITLQNENKSKIDEPLLNIIELYNARESLFERLFRICVKNGWDSAYDTLVYQGRMHEEIAKFPNLHFYEGILRPISSWQRDPLTLIVADKDDTYQQIIAANRIAFIDCAQTGVSLSDKVNYNEADIAVDLSKAILEIYKANGLEFDTQKTIGIITPYRNQIALIRHKLGETQVAKLQHVMIDTVERFQGSQRDIIILSFCINKPYQLDFFSNMNQDNSVDRKLNVALTRARKQLFMIGNAYVLSQNSIYRKLLESLPRF